MSAIAAGGRVRLFHEDFLKNIITKTFLGKCTNALHLPELR